MRRERRIAEEMDGVPEIHIHAYFPIIAKAFVTRDKARLGETTQPITHGREVENLPLRRRRVGRGRRYGRRFVGDAGPEGSQRRGEDVVAEDQRDRQFVDGGDHHQREDQFDQMLKAAPAAEKLIENVWVADPRNHQARHDQGEDRQAAGGKFG